MGILKRNKSFVVAAALICLGGCVIMGLFTALFAFADESTTPTATASTPASYNSVDSYGMTGYASLTLKATDQTPKFISKRLDDKRGFVLLVYDSGAGADEAMLSAFNTVKKAYGADMSFFAFKAKDVTQLGDTLDQLKVTDPPILAIVRADGTVANEYTGWISEKVLEQNVADAARGY